MLISSRTTFSLAIGKSVIFRIGGSGTATVFVGSLPGQSYVVGQQEAFIGPFTASASVVVDVANGSIEYVIDRDGVLDDQTPAIAAINERMGEQLEAGPPALFSDDLVVITATAPIKCGGGVLKVVRCSAGSAITVTVKDSPHDATGRTVFTQAMSAGDIAYPNEIAINGMYASFTGTATFEFEMSEVI